MGREKEYTLGKTIAAAYKAWSERLELHADAKTFADLLDRYTVEMLPEYPPKSQETKLIAIRRLRPVFGMLSIVAIKPSHAYKYIDLVKNKHGHTSAIRDFELLSHAMTKAVEWGLIDRHPFIGQMRKDRPPPRDRYVTDAELDKATAVAPDVLRLYIQFKMATGLRRKDILLLRREDLREDGIHVQPTKTMHTTRKRLIFEWTDELRELVDQILNLPRKIGSVWLFATRKGQCYMKDNGTANGFDSLWSRFMEKVVASGVERFQERDLRTKSATDEEDLQAASRRLGHADLRTTKRNYRVLPEKVTPLKRRK